MQEVEVQLGDIKWPAKCCCCGSENFKFRNHRENVVVRTLLSVTEFRKISLSNVPICDRCSSRKFRWFLGTIVLAAIGTVALYLSKTHSNNVSSIVPITYILATVTAIVGVKKAPIKIVSFDERTNSIVIRISDDGVAKEFGKLELTRNNQETKSKYVETYDKKLHKQDKEAKYTIRILCGIGIIGGVFMIVRWGGESGYAAIIASTIILSIYELKRAASKWLRS